MGQHEGCVNPCLERKSNFTFGHGGKHCRPIAFTIPEGQDVDVCFIKILVTTKAVDIGPIKQSGPPPTDTKLWGGILLPAPDLDVEWASAIFTVESRHAQSVFFKCSYIDGYSVLCKSFVMYLRVFWVHV